MTPTHTSAETCAREFFEIEDAAHRSMQGSHGYTDQRNTRLAALIERERLEAFRYGMQRAAELANISDMTQPGAAGEYIYDRIDSVCAKLAASAAGVRE